MARKESVQRGGIILAEGWKLHPMDDRNWELCQLTESGWRPYGRYYSYNTVDQALLYVADQLTKAKCYDESLALVQALDQWRETVDALAARMGAAR